MPESPIMVDNQKNNAKTEASTQLIESCYNNK